MDVTNEKMPSLPQDTLRVWKAVSSQSGVKMPKIQEPPTPEINKEFAKWIDENDKVKKLSRLDLSSKNLTSVPPELRKLGQLRQLNLSHNELSELPDELYSFQFMTLLQLSYNQFSDLPVVLKKLHTNLTSLWLDHNKFTKLPPELGELKNLERLHLHQNNLSELPVELGRLSKLSDLTISKNAFSEAFQQILNLHKKGEKLDIESLKRDLNTRVEQNTGPKL